MKTAYHIIGKQLVIGTSSREFIENRQLEKNALWKELTEGWNNSFIYAQKTFEMLKSFGNEISVQALNRVSNTLCIANEGNEADDCYKAKENGFVLSSLGYRGRYV